MNNKLYNPITGSYYEIRTEDTEEGNKGSIIGLWEDRDKNKLKTIFRKKLKKC